MIRNKSKNADMLNGKSTTAQGDFEMTNPFGKCKYEFRGNTHWFKANNWMYGIPNDIPTSMILSTKDDIADTCRGLLDIAAVAEYDKTILKAFCSLKGLDTFIPTFVGSYHSALLENNPVSNEMVDRICGMFSDNGSTLFKRLISMFVDLGHAVAVIPIADKSFSHNTITNGRV